MITVGTMRLPQPEPLDDLGAFLRGLEPDGGYWLTMRRLADHDHSGGLMGVPVAGGGGAGADVTLTGTEGVTVVESPANTFALGLTASPDANNTVEVRANGIYSAAGAIPPEYVTDAELASALGPYALDTDLANHAAAADPHAVYQTAAEVATAISAHAGAADPHPTYLTLAEGNAAYVGLAGGSVMTGLLGPTTTNTRDLGTTALRWRKLWAVDAEFTNAPTVGGAALLTQSTADALFLTPAEGNAAYATPASVTSAISTHAAAADPHAVYLTQSEGDARYRPIAYVTDVTVTGDNGVGVTESPANTFALATRVSPDGANILVLRANGLYAPAAGTDPAITARITALETSVAALKVHVHELDTFGSGVKQPTGGVP